MSPTILMLAAMSASQPGVTPPAGSFPVPMPAAPVVGGVQRIQAEAPPAALPTPGFPTTPGQNLFPQEASRAAPSPQAADDEAEAEGEEKWFIMRRLEGTALGTLMAERRVTVSGWVQQSYTWSTTDVNNGTVVWNDRANKYLLNQLWLRLDKAVDLESSEASWGYRADILYGTDYRFTMMRGLLPGQLVNSDPNQQNLYGIDPIQFYVNVFLPNLFQGTDIRAGRLFVPYGYESFEAPNTPFVSRSYAFNWAPPFTHLGIMMSPKFSDTLSGKFMLANGNDIWFDHLQEMRFVGAMTWQPRDEDAFSLGWTLGRGKMNTGPDAPFNPATVSLNSEPAGRNNFNNLDFLWTHTFTEKFNTATEVLWGHQWGVPVGVPGGLIHGDATKSTANWLSFVQYFNYALTDKWASVTRFEMFDDARGQRTGFEGLYTAITTGLQYTPVPDVILRPSIRYDTNNYSQPFEGKHFIWTGAMEAIVRF